MGNGFGKLTDCLSRRTTPHRRSHHGDVIGTLVSDPYLCSDEGFGHSFCYVRPVESQEDPPPPPVAAGFRAISGASVSANTSTAPFSSSSIVLTSETASAAAFDSSESFFSVPLQPVPRLLSGPLDRGFLSGPIERGFMSGPIDPNSLTMGIFSGPLSGEHHHHFNLRRTFSSKPWLLKGLGKVFRRSISRGHKVVSFSSKELESAAATLTSATTTITTTCSSSSTKLSGCSSFDRSEEEEEQSSNLHWAQGKAGEDRVHVVVSEDEGWVFVGIYDGFNGPDATDYLLSNLYSSMSEQLKGVSLEEKAVFEAMKKALRKTEEGFLGIADKVVVENPELALMGSCVLAMVMKGDDVYLMNVGDSRAVVGRAAAAAAPAADEEEVTVVEQPMSSERTHRGLEALQLTVEHSTSVEEELCRIRKEHPEDANAIVNDRVKGSLKVTRAFGAGFLKKPKWNDALLEMFRVDYVGNSPYITCDPSLSHHKLDHRDRFLILSSDGLYQYFTNEEAAVEVEAFMATSPEGDPAQHLIEEVLFRAAKKAGLDFHELLAIPQGDRRRYHDDVSVIVISLEGRIWRSSM